jgi:nitrite reductase (NO-forming)
MTLTVAALAAAGMLAACGAGDDPTIAHPAPDRMEGQLGDDHMDRGNSQVPPGARQIEVTADDFRFEPDEIVVRSGEDIAIALTSLDMFHDFVIDELGARIAAGAGDTSTGGFRAGKPGTYVFYCSVPGHRQAGMLGNLIVEEG